MIALVLTEAGQGANALLVRDPVAAIMDRGVADLGVALVDPSEYALPFELASLLLTGAMIGAIVIAREEN